MTHLYMHSEVLKAMGSDGKVVHLGANVRFVRRTHIGETILELERDNTCAYN